MIKRLPRFAEVELQAICARADALCHSVDEDESGWDRHIELPEKPYRGPADTTPPRSTAYVQVKSTRTRRLTCRIKLSNALRAARSPQPWFVLLFRETQQDTVEFYALHFWDEAIRRTLEAVRRAESEGQPLHKKSLELNFESTRKQSHDIIPWMQSSIDAVKPEYEEAKRAIYRTVGYEESSGEGLMTFEAASETEILKNFLGLGNGLPIKRFTFTPSRFRIPSRSPEIDVSSGIVRITPHPRADIELRLRKITSSQTITLPGKLYGASLPGRSREKKGLRFSGEFLEIVWEPDEGVECHVNFKPDEKYDLKTFEDVLTFYDWCAHDTIEMQVWSEGRRVIAGTLGLRGVEQLNYGAFAAAVRLLRSIAGAVAEGTIKVCLNDLVAASGLKTFLDISGEGSLRVTFSATLPLEPRCTEVLYWFHVDVGDYAFYALVERRVVEDVQGDGERCVTAGAARLVDTYVLVKPTESDRDIIQADYEQRLARLNGQGFALGLGDFREFLSAKTPKAA